MNEMGPVGELPPSVLPIFSSAGEHLGSLSSLTFTYNTFLQSQLETTWEVLQANWAKSVNQKWLCLESLYIPMYQRLRSDSETDNSHHYELLNSVLEERDPCRQDFGPKQRRHNVWELDASPVPSPGSLLNVVQDYPCAAASYAEFLKSSIGWTGYSFQIPPLGFSEWGVTRRAIRAWKIVIQLGKKIREVLSEGWHSGSLASIAVRHREFFITHGAHPPKDSDFSVESRFLEGMFTPSNAMA